jgi:hypothetical protein
MKTKKLLLVGLVAVLFAIWGITSAVLAAEQEAARGEANPELIFAGSLNAGSTTDVYHVLCPVGTARLVADVQDLGGVDGNRFNVLVMDSGGNPAQSVMGPDGGFSFQVQAAGGPGAYYVIITKTSPLGPERYDTLQQCRSAGGVNLFTASVLVQNQ